MSLRGCRVSPKPLTRNKAKQEEERQPELEKNKKSLREPNEQPAQIHASGVNMTVNRKSVSHADGSCWTLSPLLPRLIASIWHQRLVLPPTSAQGFTLRLLH